MAKSSSSATPPGKKGKVAKKSTVKPKKKEASKKQDAAPSDQRPAQGTVEVPGMTKDEFSLPSFSQAAVAALKCRVVPGKQLKFATACSGSGAPSLVLQALTPSSVEVMACDVNPSCAHALLLNAKPLHCHSDLAQQVKHKSCYCYICNKHCPVPTPDANLDLLIVGFPCNPNSLMNKDRFKRDATETSDAKVFLSTCDLIQKYQPKIFILENVEGVHRKKGGDSNSTTEAVTVADWILQQLKVRAPSFVVKVVSLKSYVLSTT